MHASFLHKAEHHSYSKLPNWGWWWCGSSCQFNYFLLIYGFGRCYGYLIEDRINGPCTLSSWFSSSTYATAWFLVQHIVKFGRTIWAIPLFPLTNKDTLKWGQQNSVIRYLNSFLFKCPFVRTWLTLLLLRLESPWKWVGFPPDQWYKLKIFSLNPFDLFRW